MTNNEGYINGFDYEKGMNISTLLMGSSHMEGTNVIFENLTVNILGKLLNKAVYNLGISGHHFLKCAYNFRAALQKYKPLDYAIIETGSVICSEKLLEEVINGSMPKIPAYDKGILSLLRSNNFLRLMYAQFFQNFFRKFVVKTSDNENQNKLSNEINYVRLLSEVLNMLGTTASNSGIKLIIAYHPPILLNKDGTLKINEDVSAIKQFSDLCKQNGIYFLDMSERFLKEYKKDYTLPYGFINSKVATGHMNKYGHKMFAEEIYKFMQRIEAK